jgi:hypothetical protein
MELGASRKEVAEIESRLQALSTAKWRFVPREEALKRLQQTEEMAEIVASLPRNPLPDAFIVEPADTEPAALEASPRKFAGWPKVAHVQLDSAWVKRFDAFLRLGKLALCLLAGLFAAGLVAVTFNTIRLQVMAQAAEIEVARMIGATDAFIRRPFYYFGALQGALGRFARRRWCSAACICWLAGRRTGGALRRQFHPACAGSAGDRAARRAGRHARLAWRAAVGQPVTAAFRLVRRRACRVVDFRQADPEAAALTGLAADLDPPAMFLHDVVGHG